MFSPNFEGNSKEFGETMGKYSMLDRILWGLKIRIFCCQNRTFSCQNRSGRMRGKPISPCCISPRNREESCFSLVHDYANAFENVLSIL